MGYSSLFTFIFSIVKHFEVQVATYPAVLRYQKTDNWLMWTVPRSTVVALGHKRTQYKGHISDDSEMAL